jgi:cysteine desulfurase
MIYLDNAATTPPFESSLRAAWPWLTGEFGNPSSTHELGLRAKDALEAARTSVAHSLLCRPSEITFTSGATESNNLAIKGIALANPRGRHIVSAKTEHSSVLQSIEFLVRHHDFTVTWLEVDHEGRISTDELRSAVTESTTLVALMWINNESGVIHDIVAIASICDQAGVPLHCDAVQAVGQVDVDVNDYRATSFAISGHKIGAPKGSGVLYVRAGTPFESVINGGGQESGMRSGTENVAWAVAIADALELQRKRGPRAERIGDLGRQTAAFIDAVLESVPRARLVGPRPGAANSNYMRNDRSPAIASFVFEGLNGETILLELERRGIICSSGSACSAGSTEPSHVLTAMGYDPDLARTAVRFSFANVFEGQPKTASTEAFDQDRVVAALIEITTKFGVAD